MFNFLSNPLVTYFLLIGNQDNTVTIYVSFKWWYYYMEYLVACLHLLISDFKYHSVISKFTDACFFLVFFYLIRVEIKLNLFYSTCSVNMILFQLYAVRLYQLNFKWQGQCVFCTPPFSDGRRHFCRYLACRCLSTICCRSIWLYSTFQLCFVVFVNSRTISGADLK